MQLQEAIEIVRNKFVAETNDQAEGEAIDRYHDAFERSPVMMEVATQVFGVQIIQQNMVRQMQQQGGPGGAAGGGGGQPGPGGGPIIVGPDGGPKPPVS